LRGSNALDSGPVFEEKPLEMNSVRTLLSSMRRHAVHQQNGVINRQE
jgi:hypothetical protein